MNITQDYKMQKAVYELTGKFLAYKNGKILFTDKETVFISPNNKVQINIPNKCKNLILQDNINNTLFTKDMDLTDKFFITLFHYLETYGLEDSDLSLTGLKNRLKSNKYVLAETITIDELKEYIYKIAQDRATANQVNLIKIIVEKMYEEGELLDTNKIKNKEIIISLIDLYENIDINNFNNIDLLYGILYYLSTGETIVLKHKRDYKKAYYFNFDSFVYKKENLKKIDAVLSNKKELLAEGFNRYKEFMIGLKQEIKKNATDNNIDADKAKSIIKSINKISKLSKKLHRPITMPEYLYLTSKIHSKKEIINSIKNLSFYKLNSILVAVKIRLLTNERLYKIRNGKSFYKIEAAKSPEMIKYYRNLYSIMLQYIANNFQKEIKELEKLQKSSGIKIALPISKKQYVGDYPEGSYYKCKDINIIGIHWLNQKDDFREERIDLDLSFLYKEEDEYVKIGWNGEWISNNIRYTGDMTDAPIKEGGAVEALIFTKGLKSGLFNVNCYNVEKQHFKLFGIKKKISGRVDNEKIISELIGNINADDIDFAIELFIKAGSNVAYLDAEKKRIYLINIEYDSNISKKTDLLRFVKNRLDANVYVDDVLREYRKMRQKKTSQLSL